MEGYNPHYRVPHFPISYLHHRKLHLDNTVIFSDDDLHAVIDIGILGKLLPNYSFWLV